MVPKLDKLNLGCGGEYLEGYVNLDYNSEYKIDVKHDLNQFPYPFPDNHFDEIYCSHILEHVVDLFKVMDELVRISKDKTIIHIRVPHFSNPNGYNDLTHVRFFGWFTFSQMIKGYYNRKFQFRIIEQRFNFLARQHSILNKLLSWIFNVGSKHYYERFFSWIFPVAEIELKLEVNK